MFSNDITDIEKRLISELQQLIFNPVSQTIENKQKPESVTGMCTPGFKTKVKICAKPADNYFQIEYHNNTR
jgi:hypothetical protein